MNDVKIGLAALLRDAAAGRSLPPVRQWNPAHCGEIDILIARDGTWHHEGTPIARPEIVRLFSTILRKDVDGYSLVTPAERMRIRVEDVPFVAVLLDTEDSGRAQKLTFTTNVGDRVTADGDHPIRVETRGEAGEAVPYIHVRDGLEARISRPVFYELAEMAVTEKDPQTKVPKILGVWSRGHFFVLGHSA